MRLTSHKLWAMLMLAALGFCLTAESHAADDDTPKETKVKDITLKIPASWKNTPPSSRLRLAQFEIPAAKGETIKTELVIYSFGGGGGGDKPNIVRWVNQFGAKDRKTKLTSGSAPQGDYILADISGTYNMPDGPPFLRKTKPVENCRMLSVILKVKGKGNYFLKAVGPKKTVDSVEKEFRAAFDADAKKEKEYKLAE